MEHRQTIEEIVEEIQRQTDAWVNARPRMPFWLMCKLIWLTVRQKPVKRVQLHPPYKLEMV